MAPVDARRTGILVAVSEQGEVQAGTAALGLGDLARLQGAVAVSDPEELTAKVWDSDEELDEFLADLRASRHASLG